VGAITSTTDADLSEAISEEGTSRETSHLTEIVAERSEFGVPSSKRKKVPGDPSLNSADCEVKSFWCATADFTVTVSNHFPLTEPWELDSLSTSRLSSSGSGTKPATKPPVTIEEALATTSNCSE